MDFYKTFHFVKYINTDLLKYSKDGLFLEKLIK